MNTAGCTAATSRMSSRAQTILHMKIFYRPESLKSWKSVCICGNACH